MSALLFSGKKGYLILLTIFELLAVLGIITLVYLKAVSYANSDPIVQKNVANDLALMIDTLVGFPENVLVEYPKDVSKYSLLVSSNQVIVFNKKDSTANKVNNKATTFTLPDNYNVGGDIEEKPRACLRKTGRNIFLEVCP